MRPSSRSSQEGGMDDSPGPSTSSIFGSGQGYRGHHHHHRRPSFARSVSSDSMGTGTGPASTSGNGNQGQDLRPSRSSPAISYGGSGSVSNLNSSSNASSSKPPSTTDSSSNLIHNSIHHTSAPHSSASTSNPHLSTLRTPTTPPPPSLRRSQSASHPLVSLSFSSYPSLDELPPLTAPLEGSFRFHTGRRNRSNSFSGSNSNNSGSSVGVAPLEDSHSPAPLANRSLPLPHTLAAPMPGTAGRPSTAEDTRGDRQSSSSDTNAAPPRVVRRAVNHKKGSLMVSAISDSDVILT